MTQETLSLGQLLRSKLEPVSKLKLPDPELYNKAYTRKDGISQIDVICLTRYIIGGSLLYAKHLVETNLGDGPHGVHTVGAFFRDLVNELPNLPKD